MEIITPWVLLHDKVRFTAMFTGRVTHSPHGDDWPRFASIACAMHEHDVEDISQHAQSYLNVLSFIVCEPIWTLVFIWTNIVSIDMV